MSIFNPNYKLLNKYITEADNNEDDDDYSIDDKEFDTDDDADKAADDLVNGDDESSADKAADDLVNDDTEEASDDSEADKAADDIVNDDDNTDTNDDTNTDTEDNTTDTDDTNNDENPDEGDDFDISLDGDDDQGDSGDGADTGDDTGMDDAGDDTGDTGDTDSGDVTNELVGKEKEIFSDLTEDQMKIKVKELKESYTTLLSVIDDINSRVTGIPKNSNNIKILKFISSKLLDLKKIANDYLINSFNTKTYIENVIFYQTSLAQLNTIKKVLEEMANKSENKDNKKAEK